MDKTGSRRPFSWWWSRALVPGLVVAIIVGILLYLYVFSFEGKLRAIQALGEPISIAECNKLAKTDQLRDVAEKVKKLEATFESAHKDFLFERTRGIDLAFVGQAKSYPIRPEAWDLLPATQAYLHSQKETLTAIDEILAQPSYISQPDALTNISLDTVSMGISITRLLKLASLERFHVGRLDEAIESAEKIVRWKKVYDPGLTLLNGSVRQVIHRGALDSLSWILSSPDLTAAQLDQCEGIVRSYQMKEEARWTLLSERATMIDRYFRKPFQTQSAWLIYLSTRDRYLQESARWLDLVELNGPQLIKGAEELYQEYQRNKMSGLFGSAVGAHLSHFPRHNSLCRLANLAIAARRFQLSEGRTIESLGELVPEYLSELPTSPFNGEQPAMRRAEDGELTLEYPTPMRHASGKPDDEPAQFRYVVPTSKSLPIPPSP
jgi:hypothetical protein